MDPVSTSLAPPQVRSSGFVALAVALLTATAACTGSVDGGKSGGPGPSGPEGMNGPNTPGGPMGPMGSNGGPNQPPMSTPVTPSDGLDVAVSGLRRLTAEQYRNTVRDLLKLADAKTLVTAGNLPSDGSLGDRFTSNVATQIQGIDADKYADAATLLADKAVANLANLVPCSPQAGNAACAQQFIENFGRRAFRRPLTTAEVERYKTVYTAGGDFTNGIRLVLQTFLQSPKFLYLVEAIPADAGGKVLAIDSWAAASRLSYFLLNSMPDDQLFAAAEKGELGSAEQLGIHATRLIADPRFKETQGFFHDQWLELDFLRSAEKSPELFKAWTPELKAALDQQLRRFVEGVLQDGDGKVETLLTAGFSFFNGPLYELYGVQKPAGAGDWAKVDFDPAQRSGLLTHAGLMAGLAHEDRTSFILRGKMVREAILCTTVPPPPAGVDASEMNLDPNLTAQERSKQHRTDPQCASCHELFDPLGFAFEIYDSTGRFRTADGAGKAIDSKSDISGTDKLNGTVANAVELAKRLGSAAEVRNCVARQWLRFALGRDPDAKEDASSLNSVFKAATDSDGKVPEILSAIARSNAFRHLKVRP
jgi:hypothetical protein